MYKPGVMMYFDSIEKSMKCGERKGRTEALLNCTRSLMQQTGWDVKKALDMLDIAQEYRPLIGSQLGQMNLKEEKSA